MMELVQISELENAIQNVKSVGKGYITNCFLSFELISEQIASKTLTIVQYEGCVFLFKENQGFKTMYYFASSSDELKKGLNVLNLQYNRHNLIVDVVGTSQVQAIVDIFLESRYQIYTYLVRMSRLNKEIISVYKENSTMKLAIIGDIPSLIQLFQKYFDPKSEQIPNAKDLGKWIESNGIMTYKEKDEIIGFIIFEITGLTSYLRYWFVHPNHREKKIGSALFNYYIYRSRDTKRQLFWVINTNDNAIKRYEHYGFSTEKMFNFVLTNRNIKYER